MIICCEDYETYEACEACDSLLNTLTMGVMVKGGSTGSALLILEADMANRVVES